MPTLKEWESFWAPSKAPSQEEIDRALRRKQLERDAQRYMMREKFISRPRELRDEANPQDAHNNLEK